MWEIDLPKRFPVVFLGSIFLLFIGLSGCFDMENTYSKIPPGPWRAILYLDPNKALNDQVPKEVDVKENLQFDEVTEGELPFNLEVIYINASDFYINILNASERIRIDDIEFKHDRATNKDTLILKLPTYDSYIKAIFDDKVLEGKWYVPSRGEHYAIGFVAYHGQDHRFTQLQKPSVMDLSGRWAVTFEIETDHPFPAVGEFKQDKNYIEGTFLTEIGDYRFLEGTVQENKLYLSCFDGAHSFLFEAKINPDSTLSGIFRNGIHYQTTWTAKPDLNARLPDPDSITYLITPTEKVNFSFPDQDGTVISLEDPAFTGKPKIVQIMGTWCPNCQDETRFLVDYIKQNPNQNIVFISLAFEKYADPKRALAAVRKFKKDLNVPYPILLAGPADKREASKILPMLNAVISYPTLLFIDKKNSVQRIHTGFTGPATSEYESFVNNFNQSVANLIN